MLNPWDGYIVYCKPEEISKEISGNLVKTMFEEHLSQKKKQKESLTGCKQFAELTGFVSV